MIHYGLGHGFFQTQGGTNVCTHLFKLNYIRPNTPNVNYIDRRIQTSSQFLPLPINLVKAILEDYGHNNDHVISNILTIADSGQGSDSVTATLALPIRDSDLLWQDILQIDKIISVQNNPPILNGWSNITTFTITGSPDGTLTNYQITITIPYQAFMQSNFADIRFTLVDGTILNYYADSITNGSTATFTVLIPSIPANPGTVTIYVGAGNASATSASNGFNTYLFFDDCSLGLTQWTNTAPGQIVWTNNAGVITGVIQATGDGGGLVTNNLIGTEGIKIEATLLPSTSYRCGIYIARANDGSYFLQAGYDYTSDNWWLVQDSTDGVSYTTGSTPALNYEVYMVTFDQNGLVNLYYNGALMYTHTPTTIYTPGSVGIYQGYSGQLSMTLFKVSKYTANQPTIGNLGSWINNQTQAPYTNCSDLITIITNMFEKNIIDGNLLWNDIININNTVTIADYQFTANNLISDLNIQTGGDTNQSPGNLSPISSSLIYTTFYAHSGMGCIQINTNAQWGGWSTNFVTSVLPNTAYTGIIWVYGPGLSGHLISQQIGQYSTPTNYLSSLANTLFTLNGTGWQPIIFNFTTGAATYYITMGIYDYVSETVTYYTDDVGIYLGTILTPPSTDTIQISSSITIPDSNLLWNDILSIIEAGKYIYDNNLSWSDVLIFKYLIKISDISSDSSDSIQIDNKLSIPDAGLVADSIARLITIIIAQSSTAQDIVNILNQISLQDSDLSWVDTISQRNKMQISDNDLSWSDVLTIKNKFGISDSDKNWQEILSIKNQFNLIDENLVWSDLLVIKNKLQINDADLSWRDILAVKNGFTISDSGIDSESVSLLNSLKIPDEGSLIESLTFLVKNVVFDIGQTTDLLSILAKVYLPDTGSITEVINKLVTISILDTLLSEENILIKSTLSLNDLGFLRDIVNLNKIFTISDLGLTNEKLLFLINFLIEDFGVDNEAISLLGSLLLNDFGFAIDNTIINSALTIKDLGTSIEQVIVQVGLLLVDHGYSLEEIVKVFLTEYYELIITLEQQYDVIVSVENIFDSIITASKQASAQTSDEVIEDAIFTERKEDDAKVIK